MQQVATTTGRLRVVFLLALAAGILAIAAGWYFEGAGRVSWILTVVLPLTIMLAYLCAAYLMDHDNLATEPFADSIYYLGFLFTLVALTVSLFSIAEEGSTVFIVHRFGVALSTTVLGLGLRIYLTNFRFAARDDLSRLEAHIGRSAKALADHFDQLSGSMTMQQKAFEASLAKAIGDLDKVSGELETAARRFGSAADASAVQFAGALKEASRKVVSAADSAAEEATESVRKVASAADSAAEKTTESVGKVAVSVSKAAGEFEKRARDSLDQLAQALESSSSGIEDATQALKEKLTETQLPADVLVDQLRDPLANLRGYMEQHNREISEWLDKNSQLGSHAERLTKSLSEAADTASTLAGSSLEGVNKAESAIADLASRLQGVSAALGEFANTCVDYRKVIGDHANEISGMTRQVGKELAIAQQHRAELESQLSKARGAVGKVHDELVEAARFVRDELRR